eukprot:13810975-Ditylum_brightwellii.AAC.1
MDNFMTLAQGDAATCHTITWHLFFCINCIFRPNDPNDTTHQEPISLKKLPCGDSTWSTIHKLLGWIVDTVHLLLSLPPPKAKKIATALAFFLLSCCRTSRHEWESLCDLLRHMAPAIPGGIGLFYNLSNALCQGTYGIALTPAIHTKLSDWRLLIRAVTSQPTHLLELCPPHPSLAWLPRRIGTRP